VKLIEEIMESAERNTNRFWAIRDFKERLRLRVLYLAWASNIPRPIGILWWRRCPYCGKHVHVVHYDRYGEGSYYYCSNADCDYEYCKPGLDGRCDLNSHLRQKAKRDVMRYSKKDIHRLLHRYGIGNGDRLAY